MGNQSCNYSSTGNSTTNSCSTSSSTSVSDLSTGAIIGIVVGSLVAVLIIVIAAIIITRLLLKHTIHVKPETNEYHVNNQQQWSHSQQYSMHTPDAPPSYAQATEFKN